MRIGLVGINYKSSPIGLRETLVRAFKKIFIQKPGVLLLTCHRLEFYFSTHCLLETQMDILSLLRAEMQESFEHALYSYFSQDCFRHLGRVVSGVDSAVFGETEIQRQVKLAYETARAIKPLPYDIHYLFQKGLKIGKEIRSAFLVDQKEVSLPWLIQEILEKELGDLEKVKILFVGCSAINRRIISFFQSRNLGLLTLCTRVKKGPFPKKVIVKDWSALKEWNAYDVVICGTYHEGYVIEQTDQILKETLLFDLGVPRNVDVALEKTPFLKLYNVDQIGEFAQRRGRKALTFCERQIEQAIERQMRLFEERKQARWRYAGSF